MSDVLTPNYGLTKPDVGGSDDTWGDKLNVNFDILDTSLKGVANTIPVPVSPATAVPLVEAGTGSVGVSVKYAREDHVHPLGPGGGGGGASVTISDNPPPSPTAGNLWWESDTGILYIYYNDGTSSQWVAISGGGTTILPSATAPIMDGTAAVGVATTYSRGDHVHPSDTSRVVKAGDTMTGALTLNADPAAPLQAATKQYVDANSMTQAAADALFVNVAGDTMTGPLNITAYLANNLAWGASGLQSTLSNDSNGTPSLNFFGRGGTGLTFSTDAGAASIIQASGGGIAFKTVPANSTNVAATLAATVSSTGNFTAGAGGATGAYYFGNTGTKYLNYDGTSFTFNGATNFMISSAAMWMNYINSTGGSTLYFNGAGNKYLNYDGANFNLVGGGLFCNAGAVFGAVSSVLGTNGVYYFGSGNTKYLNYDGTNFNFAGGFVTAPTPPVGDNSTNLATTAFVQRVRNSVNRVINGQFRVDQRNLGAATNPASHGLFCDMWRIVYAAGSITCYGQQYAWMVQGHCTLQTANANTKFGAVTKIEQRDCADLRSKTVVASAVIFPTQATITNYRMAILEWTGTVDTMTNPISAWNATGTNPTLAAGYVYVNTPVNLTITTGQVNSVQVSGAVSSSMNNLSVLIWSDGVNAAGDYFHISDVQLEVGSVASVYDRRPYGQELSLCQRYAWTWRNPNGVSQHVGPGGALSATSFFIDIPTPVEMRIPSTGAIVSSPTAFNVLTGGAVLTLIWNAGGLTSIALTGTVAGGFVTGNFTSLYSSSVTTISFTGAEM